MSPGVSSAKVELSFQDVNSGGVTDLSALRIAQWITNWTNQGNFATTGSAGASGSVTSEQLMKFDSLARYFTLSSVVSNENPLPQRWIQLSVEQEEQRVKLHWSVPADWLLKEFTLERSVDGQHFSDLQKIPFNDGGTVFEIEYREAGNLSRWFRVKAMDADGNVYYSNVARLFTKSLETELEIERSIILSQQLVVRIRAQKEGSINLVLFNILGQRLLEKQVAVKTGTQEVRLQLPSDGRGILYLYVWNKSSRSNLITLVR